MYVSFSRFSISECDIIYRHINQIGYDKCKAQRSLGVLERVNTIYMYWNSLCTQCVVGNIML